MKKVTWGKKIFSVLKIAFSLIIIAIFITLTAVYYLTQKKATPDAPAEQVSTAEGKYFFKLEDVSWEGIVQSLWFQPTNGEAFQVSDEARIPYYPKERNEFFDQVIEQVPAESKYAYFTVDGIWRPLYSYRLVAYNKETKEYTTMHQRTAVVNPFKFSPDHRSVAILMDPVIEKYNESEAKTYFVITSDQEGSPDQPYVEIVDLINFKTTNRYYLPKNSTFYTVKHSNHGLVESNTRWTSNSTFQIALFSLPTTQVARHDFSLKTINVIPEQELSQRYNLREAEFRHGFGDQPNNRYHFVPDTALYTLVPDGSWALAVSNINDLVPGSDSMRCSTDAWAPTVPYIPCIEQEGEGISECASFFLAKSILRPLNPGVVKESLMCHDVSLLSPSRDRIFVYQFGAAVAEIYDLNSLTVLHTIPIPDDTSVVHTKYSGPPLGGGGYEFGDKTGWQGNDLFRLQLYKDSPIEELDSYKYPIADHYNIPLETIVVDLAKE